MKADGRGNEGPFSEMDSNHQTVWLLTERLQCHYWSTSIFNLLEIPVFLNKRNPNDGIVLWGLPWAENKKKCLKPLAESLEIKGVKPLDSRSWVRKVMLFLLRRLVKLFKLKYLRGQEWMNPVKDYYLVIKKQDNTTPGVRSVGEPERRNQKISECRHTIWAEAEQNRKHKERLSGV